MLTDFQHSFTDRLSSTFLVKQSLNISPHFKCVATLPYEIVVLKNTQSWVVIRNSSTHPVMLASFLFTDENIDPSIYSSHTEKPTEWLTVHTCSNQEPAATKKKDVTTKRLRTRLTFSHWWHQLGETQVVDSTPVWYLSITKSRLITPIIVMWCCYNSFCLLNVTSQASSSFSMTAPRRTQRLDSQLFYP